MTWRGTWFAAVVALLISADNSFKLSVNGFAVADGRTWDTAIRREVAPVVRPIDWTAWRERQRKELASHAKPDDPPGKPTGHPIDRFMSAWWSAQGIEPPAVCDEATFVRRVYLDAVGLLPNETELRTFLDDKRPDKQDRLIDTLLANDLRYAEGWMAWWCDLLRNDEQTNIDDLRKPITQWLFAALKDNRPYDAMVADLLYPEPDGPDGYLKGINWRGTVNASQRPEMQAAQNVGQVFLGTNIKCVSCHDHFTKPMLLDDSYALASFFSEKNLEINRCDKPTGDFAKLEFPFARLGKLPADADRVTRLRTVARMVTTPRNPRFAPTMVNRLWKKLCGRGLFEPVDDVLAKPANPALLDWLAYDFMAHDYDLKHTIRLIMTSRAYQLASVVESIDTKRAADKEAVVYVGPPLRRLSAEQFRDGVSGLTGHWPKTKTMDADVPGSDIRAWRHKLPGALVRALGRPNREQVCTQRVEDPSMLQMLEMTNGKVLADLLTKGVRNLLGSPLGTESDPDVVLDVLYMRALARKPTAAEREILRPMIGRPGDEVKGRAAGWEDVCWTLVMSPEFQFIQ